MSFLLGEEARENAKRSIKALRAHAQSQGLESEPDHRSARGPGPTREPLFLVLNTKQPLVRSKDFTPRVVPITHKLGKVDEKAVALIARDGSYRAHLIEKGSPTEDLFHEIIPFQKIKSMAHSKKAMVRLFKENDTIVADARIYKQLPEILGSQFYGKNKKVPFKVLMAMPVPGKKTHGRTDRSCEPKYVRAQLKSILGNTSFIPPAGGTCMHIVVGYTDWKVSEVLTNINDVIAYLTDSKFRPVGGLLRSVESLHSVLIKTSNSVALPVKEKRDTDQEESESSDF